MKLTKEECLEALENIRYSYSIDEIRNGYEKIKQLINEHFGMLEHMKETSLYDVYEYEKTLVSKTLEPMRITAIENEDLKKEVNDLRKKLGLSEKYKSRGTKC